MCSVQGSFKKQVLYVWNKQKKTGLLCWTIAKKIILICKYCIAFKLYLDDCNVNYNHIYRHLYIKT